METRLTLTIDERMVNVAKAHARTQGKTLSQLVAEYFQALSKHGASRYPQTPILSEISGVLRKTSSKTKARKDYHAYLEEKYR